MDSISKLISTLDRIEDSDADDDVKIRDQWFTVKSWARDVLSLDENINSTSLHDLDKHRRKERALQEIKPI